MKIIIDDNFKFNFFIFLMVTIITSIVTFQIVKYSGYDQADSAMMKKIENLVTMLKESDKHNEELSKKVEDLEKEIFELQHGISPKGASSSHVKELYQMAGLSDITGRGAIITIKEQTAQKNQQQDYANVLQSDDLLRLINLLKSAGATAISVNNQRLVVTSEITNADNNIIINTKKIAPPYVIKVLGDFDTINSTLNIRGGMVEYLLLFNITVDIEKADNLTIKGYK